MVKVRHSDATSPTPIEVGYRNSQRPRSRFDVFGVADLLQRMRPDAHRQIERLDFHLWVLITHGRCNHMVDFEQFSCRPGSILHVAPGRTHRWDLDAQFDGVVLLVSPALAPPTKPRQGETLAGRLFNGEGWPTVVDLPASRRPRVTARFETLRETYDRIDDTDAARELLVHLAAVTLLEVAGSAPGWPNTASTDDHMGRFREAVERSFRVTRSVGDYAAALGCSTRTLDRHCRDATGRSAKTLIDDRVVLEAKRLLSHTDATLDAIGSELGFSEPTNFAKFFRARTRSTAGAFRRAFH